MRAQTSSCLGGNGLRVHQLLAEQRVAVRGAGATSAAAALAKPHLICSFSIPSAIADADVEGGPLAPLRMVLQRWQRGVEARFARQSYWCRAKQTVEEHTHQHVVL